MLQPNIPTAVLPHPCLMLVTDRKLCKGSGLPEAVARAVKAGVHIVQFREKDLSPAALLSLGAEVQSAMKRAALFVVNDRADVAVALEADGVHLPEEGLPVEAARLVLASPRLVGRSVHSVETALAAEAAGADYIVFGPVYATDSHPGTPGAGLEALRAVAAAVRIPALAIGGVTAERVPETLAAGAAGVAVVTSILSAPDPGQAAAALVAALG